MDKFTATKGLHYDLKPNCLPQLYLTGLTPLSKSLVCLSLHTVHLHTHTVHFFVPCTFCSNEYLLAWYFQFFIYKVEEGEKIGKKNDQEVTLNFPETEQLLRWL